MPDVDKAKVTLGVAAATFAFLFIQGAIAIWWAANMSADMRNMKELVTVASTDRYSGEHAKRDFAIRDNRLQEQSVAIKTLEQQRNEDRFQFELKLAALKASMELKETAERTKKELKENP